MKIVPAICYRTFACSRLSAAIHAILTGKNGARSRRVAAAKHDRDALAARIIYRNFAILYFIDRACIRINFPLDVIIRRCRSSNRIAIANRGP